MTDEITSQEQALAKSYEFANCPITFNIQIFPEDGSTDGRRILIGIRNHQDAPIFKSYRSQDFTCVQQLLSIIPIYPIYPDWWNSELEDLPKTFQLVLFISGNIELSFFYETPDWLKPELSRIIGGCDFLKLEALCKQAKALALKKVRICHTADASCQ